MTDDEIRELLPTLPRSSFAMPGQPPGTIAVLRARVVDAEADPDEVHAWVEAHGGYAGWTEPIQLHGHRPRRLAEYVPSEMFYVVPRAALDG